MIVILIVQERIHKQKKGTNDEKIILYGVFINFLDMKLHLKRKKEEEKRK